MDTNWELSLCPCGGPVGVRFGQIGHFTRNYAVGGAGAKAGFGELDPDLPLIQRAGDGAGGVE